MSGEHDQLVTKETFQQTISSFRETLSGKASKTGMWIVIGLLGVLIIITVQTMALGSESALKQKGDLSDYVKETTAINTRQDTQIKQLEERNSEILETLIRIESKVNALAGDVIRNEKK